MVDGRQNRFQGVLMRVHCYLIAAAVALTIVPASAQDRMERILASKVLRVGTTMDTPVFSMRNATTGSERRLRRRRAGAARQGTRRREDRSGQDDLRHHAAGPAGRQVRH